MAESDSRPYGVIYLVTNTVTGKVYVGQTIGTLANRWKGHCNAGKSSRLWLSIQTHGRHAFTIEKIAEAFTKSELDDLECMYIAQYRATESDFGYNFARGGSGVPKSKAAAERGAAKLRGRTLTQEHKDKIAAAKRGVKQTAEHVANMIAAKTGYSHTQEARARMSAASMGKKMPAFSQEHRQRLSLASKALWARRKTQEIS